MSNILDQLMIEISMDPKKFIEGMKKTLESSKKGQEELIKHTKGIEESAVKGTEAIAGLARGFTTFFAILAGARAAQAVAQFMRDIARMEQATGRLAQNLGVAPNKMSAFGQVIERMGGNAGAAYGTIESLYEKMFRLRKYGESPGDNFFRALQAGGVSLTAIDRAKDPVEMTMLAASAVRNIAAGPGGRAEARMYGKTGLGLDDGVITAFIELSEKQLREKIAEAAQSTALRDKDVEAAKRLHESFTRLSQTVDRIGQLLVTYFEPAIKSVVDFVSKALGQFTTDSHEGMQVDLNQSAADIAKNGARYVPKGSQIQDPNQGFFERNFGGARYITDPNYKGPPAESNAEATPESSTAGAGAQATGGGSAYRASRLAGYFAELDRDPQLRRDVIKTVSMEGEVQSNLEQMANYSLIRGYTSLRQALDSPFYGPWKRNYRWRGRHATLNPDLERRGAAAIAAVRGGSNIIDWRTDQGLPTDPNGSFYRTHPGLARHARIRGADFFDHIAFHGHEWAIQQRELERQYNAANSGPAFWTSDANHAALARNAQYYGASTSAATSNSMSNYTNSTSSMYLNGPITVNTKVTDAEGFGRDLPGAITMQTNAALANGAAQ